MTHDLKTHPPYFEQVARGHKRVEIRSEADRHFAVGDTLVLREYRPDDPTGYTGRVCRVVITDILRAAPWVPAGYAALSVQVLADTGTWVLPLNQYQRDNLLWLLTCLGYGAAPIEPFHVANSGDWVGEIASMLAPDGHFLDGYPNTTRDELTRQIAAWRAANATTET